MMQPLDRLVEPISSGHLTMVIDYSCDLDSPLQVRPGRFEFDLGSFEAKETRCEVSILNFILTLFNFLNTQRALYIVE